MPMLQSQDKLQCCIWKRIPELQNQGSWWKEECFYKTSNLVGRPALSLNQFEMQPSQQPSVHSQVKIQRKPLPVLSNITLPRLLKGTSSACLHSPVAKSVTDAGVVNRLWFSGSKISSLPHAYPLQLCAVRTWSSSKKIVQNQTKSTLVITKALAAILVPPDC